MTYFKRLYANMGVKISVWTSTIQSQAISQNFGLYVLNLKMSESLISFVLFGNPLYNGN